MLAGKIILKFLQVTLYLISNICHGKYNLAGFQVEGTYFAKNPQGGVKSDFKKFRVYKNVNPCMSMHPACSDQQR